MRDQTSGTSSSNYVHYGDRILRIACGDYGNVFARYPVGRDYPFNYQELVHSIKFVLHLRPTSTSRELCWRLQSYPAGEGLVFPHEHIVAHLDASPITLSGMLGLIFA